MTWLTPLAQGQTSTLTSGATVFVDGTTRLPVRKRTHKYYPFEFYDTINAALNPKDTGWFGCSGYIDVAFS